MPFSSQHGLVVTHSQKLVETLVQDGHAVISIPESADVLQVIIANPQLDLLILDSGLRDIDFIIQALSNLVHIPGRIVIRENLSFTPDIKNSSVILLDTKISDETLSKTVSQSFAPLVQSEKKIRRILIIDDVTDLLDMYKMMFKVKGYESETAVDGLDGIAKASQYKPDIILLDIMMPHMDGYEMMKTLKENTSLQSVIVVNSNIEGNDVVEKIYTSGADYYLRKSDFTPSQIVYMIEKGLFDQKRKKTDPIPSTHFSPSSSFFDGMVS